MTPGGVIAIGAVGGFAVWAFAGLAREVARLWDQAMFGRDAERLIGDPAMRWSERVGPGFTEQDVADAEARELSEIATSFQEITALRFFHREEWTS